MRITGAAAVVLGGLTAAVAEPLALAKGSWAAAYLVLVVGVAQIAMGSARQRWNRDDSDAGGWAQFTMWNLGNVAVIIGTATSAVLVVFAGAALLVVALVLAILATFGIEGGHARTMLLGYRALLVLLGISIPVGMVLSAIRNL